MRHNILIAATIAATTLLTGLTGCDNKIGQCKSIIDVINEAQGPLKQAVSGSDPKALNKFADKLDEVAKTIGAVELKDEKLVAIRGDYAKMATDLATASREAAAALEANDAKKAAEKIKTMQSFSAPESELVNRINGYCRGD